MTLIKVTIAVCALSTPALAGSECKLDVAHPIIVPAKVGDKNDTLKKAYVLVEKSATVFMGRMEIDADGSPHAYAPGDKGLDYLKNARSSKGWVGIATDAPGCGPTGNPVVQGQVDPAPGYYVSTTTLTSGGECDQASTYVDSEKIPYVALPPRIGSATCAGRLVIVGYNEKIGLALQADDAPAYGIGEGSIALAKSLEIKSDARIGGLSTRDLVYVVLQKNMGFPDDAKEVNDKVQRAFERWGEKPRLDACRDALAAAPR